MRRSAAVPADVLDGNVSAMQEQFGGRFEVAIDRIVQWRGPARQIAVSLAGTRPPLPPIPKLNSAPVAVLGVHSGFGCDEQSEDSAIAVVGRHVQGGEAIHPAHDGRWARRGYPSPNRCPKTNQQAGPEGRPRFALANVNGESSPSGLGALPIPLATRAPAKRAQRRRRELPRSGNMGAYKLQELAS